MGRLKFNVGEVVVALAIITFGIFIVTKSAFNYDFGSARRMGPGFFPMLIGSFVIVMGVLVFIENAVIPKIEMALPWRAILAISAGLGGFAVLAQPIGMVPATIVLVMISLLAEENRSWKLMAGLSVALSAIGYFIFHVGFRIPLDPFWW